jgi:hypothetical protein
MYDVDKSGSINVAEMTNIITTMDELEGDVQHKVVAWCSAVWCAGAVEWGLGFPIFY